MKFIKKINNNVAFARDNNGIDYIVLRKGLGFNRELNSRIPDELIDRVFKSETGNNVDSSLEVLKNMDPLLVEITTRVSRYAEEKLDITFDNTHYLILADHLNYAIKRIEEGIEYVPLNQWELKKLFPREYKVAKEVLKIIKNDFSIELDIAEISFITNHFVNANSEYSSLQDSLRMTKLIKKIVNLVEYQFQIELDEDSFGYSKFISHLRYFILRKMNDHMFGDNILDDDLIEIFKFKYPEANKMAEKIEEYLYIKEGWTLTEDEKLYLTVHVRRLTHNEN